MTIVRRSICLIVASLSIGCSNGLAPLGSSSVAGNWQYAGTQEIPQSATLNGSLTWYSVASSTAGFEGGASLTERLPDGKQRELQGVAAGSIYADSIADFDIVVQGVARRHVGFLRGDSITGSWVASSGTATVGRFTLHRTSAQ